MCTAGEYHGAWCFACRCQRAGDSGQSDVVGERQHRDTHVEPMAINALRHKADDYLRKPFDGAEFQAALDRTISRLTLARQNAALRRHLGTEK